ncbi:twin-arginine translocase TatA/TatE family subunit [Candidatus Bathyarchaeota archaeon]|nr:twin-arginine translocase TatA/TatE family subunit [Candidatus Bathyarchaeota archaeon]
MTFIGPWEIALILVIILIIFGSKKLPELARGLGDAVRHYKLASEGSDKISLEPLNISNQRISTRVKSDDILIITAKQLGITTGGKTMEEISSEIASKTTGRL